jgi:hypothetical protein
MLVTATYGSAVVSHDWQQLRPLLLSALPCKQRDMLKDTTMSMLLKDWCALSHSLLHHLLLNESLLSNPAA